MSGQFGGGGVNCTICNKIAFPAETVSHEKKPYHIECFRCQESTGEGETCNKRLDASSTFGFEGKIYCKQCFTKGGYTQKQRKVKWVPKASTGDSGPASKFGGGGTPCPICSKSVYPAEAVPYEKKLYHQECFKCVTCTKKITAVNASMYDDIIYCKRCFSDGGFAQKQRSVKWEKKEGSGDAVASKFGGGGNLCKICNKTVYSAEEFSFDKASYHVECFKCATCSKKMTPSDAAAFEGEIHCRKCFAAGGYNKKQAQSATKTSDAPKTYDNRFAKFGGGGDKCVNCKKTVYPAEKLSFEKNIYHIDCFTCSHEGCAKGGKAMDVNDAQYIKDKDTSSITIYCTKCFGELRIGK